MGSEIPRAVLSRQFGDSLNGRRLLSAVFITFRFDPGFFEQEVLPVFFDVPLSHATALRLLGLEEALRTLPGHIAVYYDMNGLAPGDAGGARLDVRRIPVNHRTGIFHPKNVFALVESKDADEDGHRPRALLVASLSANLTRAGWWENVEACHIEEIPERGKTRLRDDLIDFLDTLRRRAPSEEKHAALGHIRAFLRDTEQRAQRTEGGVLHTHFYSGKQPFIEFLDEVAGVSLKGMCLEVISPYFDDAADSKPLGALIERYEPRETRVFLPRGRQGEALCSQAFHAAVRALGASWGSLPREVTRLGKAADAGDRTVHAKVYRFFTPQPKREILFVGSVNLTTAAHSSKANLETGFLVEVAPPRRPDFWLSTEDKRPSRFEHAGEDEGTAASGGTRLRLRYHWDRGLAEAYWDDRRSSPALRVEAQGELLFEVEDLPQQTWRELPDEVARRLAAILRGASFLTVHGEGEAPGALLVQEEGMSHRPSLLMDLSAADILKSWSLLTAEQRAAFIEARAQDLIANDQGADLVAKTRLAADRDSMFARFAGIFHAFGCLDRSLREAFAADNEREANYRLFGKKHDSLGSLIQRVVEGKAPNDPVDRYVIVLCARQLCAEVKRAWPDYWQEHAADVKELSALLTEAQAIREALVAKDPVEMAPFLAWFDDWFLRRAKTQEAQT